MSWSECFHLYIDDYESKLNRKTDDIKIQPLINTNSISSISIQQVEEVLDYLCIDKDIKNRVLKKLNYESDKIN